MAKLADAQDLKSWDPKGSCGFDSHPRHPPAFARFAGFGEAGPSLALRTSARQVRHAGAIRASVFKADLAFALLKAFQSLSAR